MIRVIGADGKGNVLIEKTDNVGKTDEIIQETEAIMQILEKPEDVREVLVRIVVHKVYRSCKLIEENAIKAFKTIKEQLEKTVEKMQGFLQQVKKVQEENRIRRETRVYQRKQCGRIRGRTRQQAKSTLKYKRYELRVYSRKERQGFHE